MYELPGWRVFLLPLNPFDEDSVVRGALEIKGDLSEMVVSAGDGTGLGGKAWS